MKARVLAKKIVYICAGAGLVSFAVFGLLHGLFIGGVIGLRLADMVSGILGGPAISSVIIKSSCL